MASPNLYDFLRQIKAQGQRAVPGAAPISRDLYITITKEQLEWLTAFLQAPGHEIHFKARQVGADPKGEPIFAQDYAIAGDDLDIFCMISEAMMQNGRFADAVIKATSFFLEHVPGCPTCRDAVNNARQGNANWQFNPHNQ